MVEHVTITDPEIHEPKGASSANSGEVYVANGAGSGSWTDPKTVVPVMISGVIFDVSTAEVVYIPLPFAGTVTKLTTVLKAAINTADSTITIKNSSGVTMGTLTVAFTGSAPGDVDSVNITTNNVFTEDDYLTVETDGGSTGASDLHFSIMLERS